MCPGLRAPAISQFLNIVATFHNLHSWVSDFSVHLRHLGLGPALWRDRQLLWSFEKFNWLLNFSDRLEILFLTEFHHSYHKLHVFAPALLHATAVNSQDLFTSAFETLRITIIGKIIRIRTTPRKYGVLRYFVPTLVICSIHVLRHFPIL